MAIWLLAYGNLAAAVSDAPIQALSAYIENSGTCSSQLVQWNRNYSRRVASGETSRDFYYRVLGYMNWGDCGRKYISSLLGELRKVWLIYQKGVVSEAEFETKETELINLLFAALADDSSGEKLVESYHRRTTARLLDLDPPKQYYNCTFFSGQPRCNE